MKRVLLFFTVIAFSLSMMGQGMNVMHNGNRATYSGGGGSSYPAVLDDGNTEGWYIAASENITTDAFGVTQWDDESGNTNHLTQTSDNYKPDFANDTVSFDGNNHGLDVTFTLNQPVTIYAVLRWRSWADENYLLSGMNATAGILYLSAGTEPDLHAHSGTKSSANTNLSTGTFGVVTTIFNGASSSLQINNTTAVTGNFGSNNFGGIGLGGYQGGTYGNSSLVIKELIVRSISDSGTDQTAIKNYLNNKYSVF